ncbi:MAG: pilX2 [Burkholderia sp.]|nr:pilX2 [Burkholderia sp.]
MNRRPPGVCKHSHGTVLLAALVMLIALMLGAAALMRMVESANLLSGNLAFKRAATLAAEAGTEAAIACWRSRTPPRWRRTRPDKAITRRTRPASTPPATAAAASRAAWTGSRTTAPAQRLHAA